MKYLSPAMPKLVPKLKKIRMEVNQNFGVFDILNMPISILMSKMIFMKYLPIVRPKLVPKSKCLEFIDILKILDQHT